MSELGPEVQVLTKLEGKPFCIIQACINNCFPRNYAPGILPQTQVAQEGFQQNLWLLGPDHVITEVGTMNLFVFRYSENGTKQLFTPSLDDGTILPGVTRQSILELAKSWGEFEVVEGRMTMNELIEGLSKGRIIEVFGSGTAAVISPVKKIRFHGVDYEIPLDPQDPNSQAGPLARRLWDAITKIQYGETPHEWSVEI